MRNARPEGAACPVCISTGSGPRPATGRRREIRCPADGALVGEVDEAGAEDAQAAVDAARRAFDAGEWSGGSSLERGRLLHRVADLLERDKAEVARAESLDTGKRLVESEYDVDDVVGVFRHYGNVAAEDAGRLVDTGRPDVVSRVVHEPIGVCALDHALELPAAADLVEGRALRSPRATPSCSSRAS